MDLFGGDHNTRGRVYFKFTGRDYAWIIVASAYVPDVDVVADAKLLHAGKVIDSMVGRGAVIEKNKRPPKGGKYIIGEFSWVRL